MNIPDVNEIFDARRSRSAVNYTISGSRGAQRRGSKGNFLRDFVVISEIIQGDGIVICCAFQVKRCISADNVDRKKDTVNSHLGSSTSTANSSTNSCASQSLEEEPSSPGRKY